MVNMFLTRMKNRLDVGDLSARGRVRIVASMSQTTSQAISP
jgi:hypothetical protein